MFSRPRQKKKIAWRSETTRQGFPSNPLPIPFPSSHLSFFSLTFLVAHKLIVSFPSFTPVHRVFFFFVLGFAKTGHFTSITSGAPGSPSPNTQFLQGKLCLFFVPLFVFFSLQKKKNTHEKLPFSVPGNPTPSNRHFHRPLSPTTLTPYVTPPHLISHLGNERLGSALIFFVVATTFSAKNLLPISLSPSVLSTLCFLIWVLATKVFKGGRRAIWVGGGGGAAWSGE